MKRKGTVSAEKNVKNNETEMLIATFVTINF
jgi:hypothetical protein